MSKLTTFIADQTDPNYQAKSNEIGVIVAACKNATKSKPATKFQLLKQLQYQYTPEGVEKVHTLQKIDVFDVYTNTKFVTGFVDGLVVPGVCDEDLFDVILDENTGAGAVGSGVGGDIGVNPGDPIVPIYRVILNTQPGYQSELRQGIIKWKLVVENAIAEVLYPNLATPGQLDRNYIQLPTITVTAGARFTSDEFTANFPVDDWAFYTLPGKAMETSNVAIRMYALDTAGLSSWKLISSNNAMQLLDETMGPIPDPTKGIPETQASTGGSTPIPFGGFDYGIQQGDDITLVFVVRPKFRDIDGVLTDDLIVAVEIVSFDAGGNVSNRRSRTSVFLNAAEATSWFQNYSWYSSAKVVYGTYLGNVYDYTK